MCKLYCNPFYGPWELRLWKIHHESDVMEKGTFFTYHRIMQLNKQLYWLNKSRITVLITITERGKRQWESSPLEIGSDNWKTLQILFDWLEQITVVGVFKTCWVKLCQLVWTYDPLHQGFQPKLWFMQVFRETNFFLGKTWQSHCPGYTSLRWVFSSPFAFTSVIICQKICPARIVHC